jgi:hypothetical protein
MFPEIYLRQNLNYNVMRSITCILPLVILSVINFFLLVKVYKYHIKINDG